MEIKRLRYFLILCVLLIVQSGWSQETTHIVLIKPPPDIRSFHSVSLPDFELNRRAQILGRNLEVHEILASDFSFDGLRKTIQDVLKTNKPKKIFLLTGLGIQIMDEVLDSEPFFSRICPFRLAEQFLHSNSKEFLQGYTKKLKSLREVVEQQAAELNIVYLGGGISHSIFKREAGLCAQIYFQTSLKVGGISPESIVTMISHVVPVIYSPLFTLKLREFNEGSIDDESSLGDKIFEMIVPAF